MGYQERPAWKNELNSILYILFLSLVICWPHDSSAVNRYVLSSANGSGTGADWTNAYTELSTALAAVARGDIIYVGTGNYICAPCTFGIADSSTVVITIKGAIASDHGTGGGWNSNFGVDVVPAIFSTTQNNVGGYIWRFTSDYWTIDGQVRTGLKTGYGFKVNNSWPHSVSWPVSVSEQSVPNNNITLRYLEVAGAGFNVATGECGHMVSCVPNVTSITCNSSGTVATAVLSASLQHVPYVGQHIAVTGAGGGNFNSPDSTITAVTDAGHFNYGVSCTPNAFSSGSGIVDGPFGQQEASVRVVNGSNFTLSYYYLHDSSGDPTQVVSDGSGFTFEYGAIVGDTSNPQYHGEGFGGQQFNGFIFRYNVMEDAEGTSFIESLCATGCPKTSDNWQIYGNVFAYNSGNPNKRNGVGDGIVFCQQTCTNFQIYNNSVVNVNPLYGNTNANLFGWQNLGNGSSCSGISVQNNLLYQDATAIPLPATSSCSVYTEDYNTFSVTTPPIPPGAHDVTGISTDFFVDWINGNYHLSSDTALWLPQGSPYNVDLDGVVRTSSRGAYQYQLKSTQTPSPPQGLAAIVN